jgi:hypothetical protein
MAMLNFNYLTGRDQWRLTWSFAILSCHCLPDEQLLRKPLSQVLRVPELSGQVRFRLVEGAISRERGELGNLLATSAAIEVPAGPVTRQREGAQVRLMGRSRTPKGGAQDEALQQSKLARHIRWPDRINEEQATEGGLEFVLFQWFTWKRRGCAYPDGTRARSQSLRSERAYR